MCVRKKGLIPDNDNARFLKPHYLPFISINKACSFNFKEASISLFYEIYLLSSELQRALGHQHIELDISIFEESNVSGIIHDQL